MVRVSFVCLRLIAVALVILVPAVARAQSGIAGVVRDTTGAVLPGVTVEASSPALIEKVRTVVTDDQGQYKIINLRPGVYAVTLTLPGFSIVKREGIELTASFTAPVNAELRVGVLSETVTVSGASPVVDVQNVLQQRVITSEVVKALPSARNFQGLGALIPGLTVQKLTRQTGQDVGGSAGDQSQRLSIHGSRTSDMQNLLEGMLDNNGNGVSLSGVYMDGGSVQEFSYQLGAVSAEIATGGVHVNVIPKEGGNRFAGTFFGAFSNHRLQSDNTTADLLARGLGAANRLDKVWDINPSFGGPIKRDKLWFHFSGRYWGENDVVAGMWYDTDPLDFVYTPDLSRPAIEDLWTSSANLRLTWQATPKNKINSYMFTNGRCACHHGVTGLITPEASRWNHITADHLAQVSWSAPVTNRLLLEAGFLWRYYNQPIALRRDVPPGTLAVTELSTGLNFRSTAAVGSYGENTMYNYKAAVSYVTGSHATKVGFHLQRGNRYSDLSLNGDMNLQLLNGVPRAVQVWATPIIGLADLNAALGIYAQDQWTIKRLTLNTGVRYDYHNASVPDQHLPAVQFLGPRDYAGIPDVPKWHDLSPRLGASYDLFGNGKTALKVSLSRYLAGQVMEFANASNPVNTSVNNATRTWTDLNGDFFPNCVMANPIANGECGPTSPATFGQVRTVTRFDDDIREGFGKREFNWETSAGIQHELMPQVAVNVAYFRRWYGNFLVTDNLAWTPADFDPYCITAPVDSRLPGGGGNQICGLYNIKPAKFGQVNNLVTFAENFRKQTEIYNGIDLTINARLPRNILLSGGLNSGTYTPVEGAGNSVTDRCFVVDSPEELRFCHVPVPWLTQVKFLGTAGLPWDFQVSGTFQSLAGPQVLATWVVPNALIAPSLGRNLSSGARGTAPVQLVQPGTLFGDRLYQVDVRLSKIFKIGRTRIQGNFDLYNALNASPVLVQNNTYGPQWQRPIYILPGRLFKFGAQVDF